MQVDFKICFRCRANGREINENLGGFGTEIAFQEPLRSRAT